MKKLITIIAVLALLTLGTGCGGGGTKKLVCTMKDDESTATVTIDHKNNKATKMTMAMEMEVETELIDDYISMMNMYLGAYDGIKGFKVDVSPNKAKTAIIITMSLDLTNIDKSRIDDLESIFGNVDFSDADLDIKTIRRDLESEGFTCK